LEAGKMALDKVDFSIYALVEGLSDTIGLRARAKNLEFSHVIEGEIAPWLHGDRERLRQVLVNLLDNAIKFTNCGQVTVCASLKSRSEHGVVIGFTVRDTGIGIPNDKRESLFDKFTQVDASTTRRYGGTGLGLAICKQIVELMGGQLVVRSELGRGSEFFFSVNLESVPQGQWPGVTLASESMDAGPTSDQNTCVRTPGSEVLEALERPSPRVLVAEDNLTNQMVTRAILEKLGYQVWVVNNGREALDALRKSRFDLVLMDVQMPTLDGWDATREIRAGRAGFSNQAIPIIAMTAHAMQGDREACLRSGMNDYVSKPVAALHLSQVLDRWLNHVPA